MSGALIQWQLPTHRKKGDVRMPPDEIDAMEVSISADGGANFTVAKLVKPPDLSHQFGSLAAGTWLFRLVAIDRIGLRSNEVIIRKNIAESSPPGDDFNPKVVIT